MQTRISEVHDLEERLRWTNPIGCLLALVATVTSGCDRPDIDADVDLNVSAAMPTVATVVWDVVSDDATSALVEFGPDRSYGRMATARIDSDGQARAVLLGMKPSSDYHVRIVEVVDEQRLNGPDEGLSTGPLLVDLPDLELSAVDEDHAHGGFLVTSMLAQPSAAVILDADGDYVWAHQPLVDWDTLFIPRSHLSHVGDWVVYHAAATALVGGDDGVDRLLVRVSLDGMEEQTIEVENAHHDFVELGDGSFAVLVRDRRMVEGELIEGDQIVRFDDDGGSETLWTVWDYAEFDPEVEYEDDGEGWSHANALQYDKDDDAFYVSLANFGSIVKIDHASGEVLWTLGGDASDFATTDGDTDLFQRQHQFKLDGDRIVVFDNGPIDGLVSRAVEYELDHDAGVAELVWEYTDDPACYTAALGDVFRLPAGDTLVTFSSQGQIDQVQPAGDLVWRLRSSMGAGIGYTDWREILYEPTQP